MPIAQSTFHPDAQIESRTRSKNGLPTVRVHDFSNGGAGRNYEGPSVYQHTNMYGDKSHGASVTDVYRNRYQGPSWKAGPVYQAATAVKEMASDPNKNPLKHIYGTSPWLSAAALGATGLVGSKLLNNAYLPEEMHTASTIGLTGLLASLGLLGHYYFGKPNTTPAYNPNAPHKTDTPTGMETVASFRKEAAMYQDARNFILEKLQGASDISSVEKATLASKIRNMSTGEAERLKTMVRAAVGFGVGRLIARFFFGARGANSFVGGAIGALTTLVAGAMHNNNVANSMFQGPRYY